MSITTGRPRGTVSHSRIRKGRLLPRGAVPAVTLVLGVLAAISLWNAPPAPAPVDKTAPVSAPVAVAAAGRYGPLLDPGLALGHVPLPLAKSAPLGGEFRPVAIALEPPVQSAQAIPAPPPAFPLPPILPRLVEGAPLPLPRPSDLLPPAAPERPRIAAPQASRRLRTAAVPVAPEDNRSFFEKLFGVQRPAGQALAYAAPQDDVVDAGRGQRLSPASPTAPSLARATAVYDIGARMVYMPNGDRLEAHSGLGDKMDDPRFAHVRMQGVTPPHVYDLTEREALFHGVRAIRLNPVGGSGAIHGRAGLLAHTYLLGPRGDSNGCVSFKDYEKFLQAFLRGEIKRLVVVASMG
ncbi:tlde1 domain-containing protein [Bosea sp. PAMC 26642]|uniref:tlde1 domain-containing protein n=1 Tax=Bosea sp. (strain PAMC 26642) TaxID=1792307 RepID=UPI0007703BD0|nr:tlde1 domain-containing protein [Bosea sp. PAMC 26642]AMJ63320.1 hypothetical protein AXW83_26150 [Bosea sp. PAMC 26642]